jgi:capsule polysaccharide export protein KpsE/RkpR
VTQTGTKPQLEAEPQPIAEGSVATSVATDQAWANSVQQLRLLWNERQFLTRAAIAGLILGTLLAFVLPRRFDSTTQLMPPDDRSSSGIAMLAALTAKTGGGLGALAGDVLGLKSSGALFVGILRSSTIEDRLVERFHLKSVYWVRLDIDARRKLEENTAISEDRKSGIISITVTDRDPKRSAAIAQAYVEELDHTVAELSTSSAHRERVFLEERLAAVKMELDQASKNFSEFASKNGAIDIKEQGKAMLDAAATLMGQLIAAESELKGLEQIYTPNNVRVRSVQARVSELHKQLEKIGGKAESQGSTSGTPPPTTSASTTDSTYPSIRRLPILGVTYADLYRRTRIQEAVYETLTQEYELAKVQEAKETPSVKVLDAANVPERKSFPPRLLIIILCTFAGLMAATGLVMGKASWQKTDAQDPRKVFAQEIFQTVRARMPWAPTNGSHLDALTSKNGFGQAARKDSAEEAEESQE